MNRFLSKSLLPIGLTCLSLVAQPVFAQVKNNEQLSRDFDAVQKSLAGIQKDMQGLRRLLDNRAMLELFQRMDDLADEVSQLRGLLEEQTHDLAGLKKRQRELYLDIDRRLRELEITSSRAPVATVAPVVDAGADQPAAEPPADQGQDPNTAPVVAVETPVTKPELPDTKPESKPEPRPAVTAISQPVSEERAAYQKAFDMLKEGRYKTANSAFRGFLEKYPQSSYAGNAQYWLGESNYVTRNFEQAVKEFKDVMVRYSSSNKVPDAMLKLGYTYYELRQFNSAREILSRLQQQFPKSTHARLAGKRLHRMKKEGH